MTRLQLLARRRELLVLSAQLQRATIKARLDRVQANPGWALFEFAVRLLQRPSVRTAALIALGDVLGKLWHRR
ncbi:MAG TPA: hypothetical protein VED83_05575 [Burkholderiaceae bacterium]|nr:hypothetical protein [Burkholderiaceae bacterium]HYB51797.1 hypothetical protein [Burkholderiaceae bacterium]